MNKKKAANYIQDLGALIALVLLIVVIGVISPEFRTVGNFLSLLRQSSINGFIAFGMTCVILTGGIDLSVGSVLALTTALCAGFISGGMPVGLAMILALVIGTGFGCISGFLVTKGRLQPFIATLITMTVFRGLTMIYMDGKPISNLGDSFTLKVIGKGNFYHIPIPVILFLLIFVIFLFVLQKTTGVNGVDVDCAIASDNVEGAKMATEYMVSLLGENAKVAELEGVSGASATIERGKGFHLVADEKLDVVSKQTMNQSFRGNECYENSKANSAIQVFAHNDEMARSSGLIGNKRSCGYRCDRRCSRAVKAGKWRQPWHRTESDGRDSS